MKLLELVSDRRATFELDGHRHYEDVYLVPFSLDIGIVLPPIDSPHPDDMFARRVPIDYAKDVTAYVVYLHQVICRYTTRRE